MTRWVTFVSVGVGVGASQRIPLSVLARNPHKGLAREISLETGKGRMKEGPRVKRSEQNRPVGRREQTVGRREQSKKGKSRDEGRAERRPVNRSQKSDC